MLAFTTYNIPETPSGKTQENEKWLLFITDQPLTGAYSEMLQKISSALQADFEKHVICIPYDASDPVALAEMVSPGSKLVISFGVDPSTIGLWIDLALPGIRTLESFSFILTLSLDALAKNANAKKELWKSMQMFLSRP